MATTGRLVDVEQQLTVQIEENVSVVDELKTCRVDKDELTRALRLEQGRTLELEADVAHLRADLEDVAELRGLDTTNRLLREDLDGVEKRLKAVQQDNSRLRQTEATTRDMKRELDAAGAALRQKDVDVARLREAVETVRAEADDLKTSLTQAETLAARTQAELVAVNCALDDARSNVDRLTARLNDEATKSQRLEKTVVDLYAELESKDLELETQANGSRTSRQEMEAKLGVSEEENARLKGLLKTAEKCVEELEQRMKADETQRVGTGSDGAETDVTDRTGTSECDAGPSADGGAMYRPVAAVLGVSVSTEAAVPPSDDDKLGERYCYY